MKFFTSKEEFMKVVERMTKKKELNSVFSLDFPFIDKQNRYTLISIPSYNKKVQQAILLLTKKEVFVYADSCPLVDEETYKEILSKPYGESSIIAVLIMKSILADYALEFSRLRGVMNFLDLDPEFEKVEDCGRELRRLTDRCEELVRLIMMLKEREIKEFDTSLMPFDYEILNSEARYLLERCRSHVYRIASLRTKSEMKSNKQLNDTMQRLTVIVTFLTIVSIVVSVPGTIGAIFGIPALSDAYFRGHALLLVMTLCTLTLGSIALGFIYWKSLGLEKSKK